MAHNLFLGMYTFSIKKKRARNTNFIANNDFLELAYHEIKENKFEKGFVQDILNLIDSKAYKNAQNTHGAILEKYSFDKNQRTLDLLINGGLTGIKQFLIDENGAKKELSNKDIIGPKFYVRFWLPAGTKSGYVFIQKYGGMSIKPIYDSILSDLLEKYDCSLVNSRIKATTTKKRLKEFLKRAVLKNITVVSNAGLNETGAAEASTVEVRLKNFRAIKSVKPVVDRSNIQAALKNHGFTMGDKKYDIKGIYEYTQDGVTEERTVTLDASEETINIIPNLVVPQNCIDIDNYPIFEEMKKLVDEEMNQVKVESKL